mmetsp:Transcript_17364/g.19337  ORF Transcript_17364/g.19337 Transcript_17364/m.19337 type:complete len:139 (+) Transcript_17364:290-706(+)
MKSDISCSFQLAAVEQHLRNDEESSVDSWAVLGHSPSSQVHFSDYTSPPELSRRRIDCATPPKVERTYRGEILRGKGGIRKLRKDYNGNGGITINSDSPLRDAEAALISALGVPGMLGMPVFESNKNALFWRSKKKSK